MPIQIVIDEDDLVGLNEHARNKIEESANNFITDLIEESNRIESGRNTTSGQPEITSSMVMVCPCFLYQLL